MSARPSSSSPISDPHQTKISRVVEQYIKIVHKHGGDKEIVSMKKLGRAMEVAPATVTSMIKHLAKIKLVKYIPRVGVTLTAEGFQLALKMVRRHRLIESFLQSILKYGLTDVHNDAESLEHAVSDYFVERLAILLDNPQFDPHGDPIPSSKGEIPHRNLQPITDCSAGDRVRISQLDSNNHEFLSLIENLGLMPGIECVIHSIDKMVGVIMIQKVTDESSDIGSPFPIGYKIGTKILVTM